MIGNPIDPSLYVDHEGQRIFFCCKMCVQMFTENPGEYLPNLKVEAFTEQSSHDHDSDHENDNANRLISYLGKFHPVAVHLPIALFLVAALAELLFLFTGAPLLRSAARFNLLVAVPATVASVLLGLAAAAGADYPEDYARTFQLHRTMGFVSMGLGIITTTFSELSIRLRGGAVVKTYRAALLLAVVAIATTGHLGGLLVFGLNHFTW